MFKQSMRLLAVLCILVAIAVTFIVTPIISSHAATTTPTNTISTPAPDTFWPGH